MQWCEKFKLEGVVSKKRDAPYVGGECKAWVKSKCEAWKESHGSADHTLWLALHSELQQLFDKLRIIDARVFR
jgi:hypothetical protein